MSAAPQLPAVPLTPKPTTEPTTVPVQVPVEVPAVSYPLVVVDDIDDVVWIDSGWREPVSPPVVPAPRVTSPPDETTGPALPALAG